MSEFHSQQVMTINKQLIADLENIARIRRRNFSVFDSYCSVLNGAPDFVTPDMIKSMTGQFGLPVHEVFVLLFASACGVDVENSADVFLNEYIRPSVHLLDADSYRQNPFYKNISIPCQLFGSWKTAYESYKPYELFVCNDVVLYDDFKEVPQLGFFEEPFKFPVIYQDNREWMAIKPNEIETMRIPIQNASGDVVAFGLGIGYYAYMVSLKPEVKSVTIVETDSNVIELFMRFILPQFSEGHKIKIIQSDAFEFVRSNVSSFDFAFVDLWHDAGDGVELYVKMRRLESFWPETRWMYWVEDTLLSHLRWRRWNQILDSVRNGQCDDLSGDCVRLMLRNEALKNDLLTDDF